MTLLQYCTLIYLTVPEGHIEIKIFLLCVALYLDIQLILEDCTAVLIAVLQMLWLLPSSLPSISGFCRFVLVFCGVKSLGFDITFSFFFKYLFTLSWFSCQYDNLLHRSTYIFSLLS